MRRIATATRHLNKFGPGRDGFTNGDPIAGVVSTDLQAEWFDSVQEELAAVVEFAGMELDPNDNTQLVTAIRQLLSQRPLVRSITELPEEDVGPIVVMECSEVWTWAATAHFIGYRSPLCGRPLDGHTVAPLANEIDAVGGALPKAAYARLWGYAQENGLVVSQATWTANVGAHFFVDVDANTFRVPDLRNMFRRYTGTDADTANARALGTAQPQRFPPHTHEIPIGFFDGVAWFHRAPGGGPGAGSTLQPGGGQGIKISGADFGMAETFNHAKTYTAGDLVGETRPKNTAFLPRIHV
ncbi:phage tail protein [Achromobacter denitrificans]|uniref:phage tail protein n=1 Tax=Achromobacter denitrificans TaxID=32002 RepID=UPI0020C5DDB1|nr:phage tail protein [Achromobacter denitrificans]